MSILLKLDYAKFVLSNLFFEKPFGGQLLGKGRVNVQDIAMRTNS